MRNFIFVLLAVFIMPLAGGCTASVLGGSNTQQSNMAQVNYAAADMLIQQSKSLVNMDTPMQIGVLTDMDHPSEITALSRVVTGQIGARFVQLGYNVSSGAGMPADDSGGMSYMPSGMGGVRGGGSVSGSVVIAGQYALAKKSILINLHLMETQTGRVLAAYDYSLPLNGDTRELAKTAADKNSFFGF